MPRRKIDKQIYSEIKAPANYAGNKKFPKDLDGNVIPGTYLVEFWVFHNGRKIVQTKEFKFNYPPTIKKEIIIDGDFASIMHMSHDSDNPTMWNDSELTTLGKTALYIKTVNGTPEPAIDVSHLITIDRSIVDTAMVPNSLSMYQGTYQALFEVNYTDPIDNDLVYGSAIQNVIVQEVITPSCVDYRDGSIVKQGDDDYELICGLVSKWELEWEPQSLAAINIVISDPHNPASFPTTEQMKGQNVKAILRDVLEGKSYELQYSELPPSFPNTMYTTQRTEKYSYVALNVLKDGTTGPLKPAELVVLNKWLDRVINFNTPELRPLIDREIIWEPANLTDDIVVQDHQSASFPTANELTDGVAAYYIDEDGVRQDLTVTLKRPHRTLYGMPNPHHFDASTGEVNTFIPREWPIGYEATAAGYNTAFKRFSTVTSKKVKKFVIEDTIPPEITIGNGTWPITHLELGTSHEEFLDFWSTTCEGFRCKPNIYALDKPRATYSRGTFPPLYPYVMFPVTFKILHYTEDRELTEQEFNDLEHLDYLRIEAHATDDSGNTTSPLIFPIQCLDTTIPALSVTPLSIEQSTQPPSAELLNGGIVTSDLSEPVTVTYDASGIDWNVPSLVAVPYTAIDGVGLSRTVNRTITITARPTPAVTIPAVNPAGTVASIPVNFIKADPDLYYQWSLDGSIVKAATKGSAGGNSYTTPSNSLGQTLEITVHDEATIGASTDSATATVVVGGTIGVTIPTINPSGTVSSVPRNFTNPDDDLYYQWSLDGNIVKASTKGSDGGNSYTAPEDSFLKTLVVVVHNEPTIGASTESATDTAVIGSTLVPSVVIAPVTANDPTTATTTAFATPPADLYYQWSLNGVVVKASTKGSNGGSTYLTPLDSGGKTLLVTVHDDPILASSTQTATNSIVIDTGIVASCGSTINPLKVITSDAVTSFTDADWIEGITFFAQNDPENPITEGVVYVVDQPSVDWIKTYGTNPDGTLNHSSAGLTPYYFNVTVFYFGQELFCRTRYLTLADEIGPTITVPPQIPQIPITSATTVNDVVLALRGLLTLTDDLTPSVDIDFGIQGLTSTEAITPGTYTKTVIAQDAEFDGNRNTTTMQVTFELTLGDTDGDGIEDERDHFPNDPLYTTDIDGDGVGDDDTIVLWHHDFIDTLDYLEVKESHINQTPNANTVAQQCVYGQALTYLPSPDTSQKKVISLEDGFHLSTTSLGTNNSAAPVSIANTSLTFTLLLDNSLGEQFELANDNTGRFIYFEDNNQGYDNSGSRLDIKIKKLQSPTGETVYRFSIYNVRNGVYRSSGGLYDGSRYSNTTGNALDVLDATDLTGYTLLNDTGADELYNGEDGDYVIEKYITNFDIPVDGRIHVYTFAFEKRTNSAGYQIVIYKDGEAKQYLFKHDTGNIGFATETVTYNLYGFDNMFMTDYIWSTHTDANKIIDIHGHLMNTTYAPSTLTADNDGDGIINIDEITSGKYNFENPNTDQNTNAPHYSDGVDDFIEFHARYFATPLDTTTVVGNRGYTKQAASTEDFSQVDQIGNPTNKEFVNYYNKGIAFNSHLVQNECTIAFWWYNDGSFTDQTMGSFYGNILDSVGANNQPALGWTWDGKFVSYPGSTPTYGTNTTDFLVTYNNLAASEGHKWKHFAAVFDYTNNEIKVYIEGSLWDTITGSLGGNSARVNHPPGSRRGFNKWTDFAMWSAKLEQKHINQIYARGKKLEYDLRGQYEQPAIATDTTQFVTGFDSTNVAADYTDELLKANLTFAAPLNDPSTPEDDQTIDSVVVNKYDLDAAISATESVSGTYDIIVEATTNHGIKTYVRRQVGIMAPLKGFIEELPFMPSPNNVGTADFNSLEIDTSMPKSSSSVTVPGSQYSHIGDTYTLSFWLNRSSMANGTWFLQLGGIKARFSAQQININNGLGYNNVGFGYNVTPINAWHHVVIIVETTNNDVHTQIYLNGSRHINDTRAKTTDLDWTGDIELKSLNHIGIDSVELVDYALAIPTGINNLYAAGRHTLMSEIVQSNPPVVHNLTHEPILASPGASAWHNSRTDTNLYNFNPHLGKQHCPLPNPCNDKYTLSIWFNVLGGFGPLILSNYDSVNDGFRLEVHNDYLLYDTCGGGNTNYNWPIDKNTSFADGEWHHIVATFDHAAGTRSLYLDGAKLTGGDDTFTPNSGNPENKHFLFYRKNGGAQFYDYQNPQSTRRFGNVHLMNCILSEPQITDIYNAGHLGITIELSDIPSPPDGYVEDAEDGNGVITATSNWNTVIGATPAADTYTVTYTATDSHGETTDLDVSVVVIDTQANISPVITLVDSNPLTITSLPVVLNSGLVMTDGIENEGTLNGGAFITNTGAVLLDGVDDYVQTDSKYHFADQFQLSAKIKPVNLDDVYHTIAGTRSYDTSSNGFILLIKDGVITGMGPQADNFVLNVTIPNDVDVEDGKYHEVVLKWVVNTELSIFLDGEKLGTHTPVGAIRAGVKNMEIGRNPRQQNMHFEGIIDEVAVVNQVQTDQEIQDSYAANPSPNSDPGAIATDSEDGDLTLQITSDWDAVLGTYPSNGTYYVTYEVTDSAGDSVSVEREVIINTPPNNLSCPEIYFNGSSTTAQIGNTSLTRLGTGTFLDTTIGKYGNNSFDYGTSANTASTFDTPITLSDEWTISLWFYNLKVTSHQAILVKDSPYVAILVKDTVAGGNKGYLHLYRHPTWKNSGYHIRNAGLTSNTWHHMAIVTTNNTTTFYVNGESVGSVDDAMTSGVINRLGGQSTTAGQSFAEKIDEFAFWEKALTPAAISEISKSSIKV